ncbi:hypothetical protein GC209_01015 [bacterium]|nr:hypothetical protein [bacterium]
MTISESAIVRPLSAMGGEISATDFGMNIVLGYERFGSKPWEKFDEIQSQVGSQLVRFPGGTMSEQLFDYANINATSAVASNGAVLQLITPDQFMDYCAATHTRATIDLPVAQLLTAGKYGSRDFDVTKADEVRSYVDHMLEKAGPDGIATFELGNEYATYMLASEYGKVASAVALIAHQEIDKYYQAHPGHDATRPDIAVQVWGQSAGGTFSLSDLASRNHTVMAQFNASELASVTAVTNHFYYKEGSNPGDPNFHTYTNIQNSINYSLDMMKEWSTLTGRPMDYLFSEWNVSFKDTTNTGLKQISVLLEMFTSFIEGGVTQLDFWSTMYNSTSLGDYHGALQAAGTLFQVMSHDLVGMKATEIPVTSTAYDIHAFAGNGHAELFISSLSDQAMSLKMDLSAYLDRYELTSSRLMQVDLAGADGAFDGRTGLHPWEEPDAPILLTPQSLSALLSTGELAQTLGAHETLILQFDTAPVRLGSAAPDRMLGYSGNDRIDALASSDVIKGFSGDDTLFGGLGDDTIFGGVGRDRINGGIGSDWLFGGSGNDTIEGRANADHIFGGYGNDYIAGGDCSDTLWGGAGADAFIFREGDKGTDLVGDFSVTQGDFLIYDGAHSVTAADFQLEVRTLHGVGLEGTPDLLVCLVSTGQVLWTLADAGNMHRVMLQDANTGALLALM